MAAYKDHQFRSNTNLGPRPTPTLPKGGTWSVYAECTIAAPPQYPYHAILDIHDWRNWNTMNPDVLVTKHSHPHSRNLKMEQGAFMTFTLQFSPEIRVQTKEVCQHLEVLKTRHDGHPSHSAGGNVTRIRWTSDNANYLTPGFVMKSERVSEIEELDGEATLFRTWISFGGLASSRYKKKYGETYARIIEDFCGDLKKRSEALYKADGGVARQANGHADVAAPTEFTSKS